MYFSVLEEELKGISYRQIFHTHRMLNRRDLQFCYYFIFNISLKFYFFLNLKSENLINHKKQTQKGQK